MSMRRRLGARPGASRPGISLCRCMLASGPVRTRPAAQPADLGSGVSAVDDQRLPGDEVGCAPGEEDDGASQGGRGAEAAEWDPLEEDGSGALALTEIPWRAHWTATSRVKATTPPLEAV